MAGYEQLQAGIREHRRRDEAEAGDASRELEANVNHERFVDEDGNLQRQPLQHVHGGPRMTTRYSTLVLGASGVRCPRWCACHITLAYRGDNGPARAHRDHQGGFEVKLGDDG